MTSRKVSSLSALCAARLVALGRGGEIRGLRWRRNDRQTLLARAPRLLLKYMDALVELSLYHIGLRKLPAALASAAHTLARLDLSRNRLTALPRWCRRFSVLRALNLRDNLFASPPRVLLTMSAVVHLDLSGNRFDALPTWFGSLTQLRSLSLCSAFNRGPGLPDSFGQLTRLRRLHLCCSPTLDSACGSWLDHDAREIRVPMWEPVYGLISLKSLLLHNMGVHTLGPIIRQLRLLTSLEGLYDLECVPSELAQLGRLRSVDALSSGAQIVPYEVHAMRAQWQDDNDDDDDSSWGTLDDNSDAHAGVVMRDNQRSISWSTPSLVDLCLGRLMRTSDLPATASRDCNHRRVARKRLVAPKRYDIEDDASASDSDSDDAIELSIEVHGRALLLRDIAHRLPAELAERAYATWSRSCAICRRPIIGKPSRIESVYQERSWVLVRPSNYATIERAFCPLCAHRPGIDM